MGRTTHPVKTVVGYDVFCGSGGRFVKSVKKKIMPRHLSLHWETKQKAHVTICGCGVSTMCRFTKQGGSNKGCLCNRVVLGLERASLYVISVIPTQTTPPWDFYPKNIL